MVKPYDTRQAQSLRVNSHQPQCHFLAPGEQANKLRKKWQMKLRHEILSTKPINNMKFIYCTLEKFLDRFHARNYLRSSCLVNQCYFSLLDGGPPEKEGEVAIYFHLRLPVLAQRRLQDSL